MTLIMSAAILYGAFYLARLAWREREPFDTSGTLIWIAFIVIGATSMLLPLWGAG